MMGSEGEAPSAGWTGRLGSRAPALDDFNNFSKKITHFSYKLQIWHIWA